MKILVTGGAGFIATNTVEELVRRGWTVRLVDCLTDYYDLGQKRSNLHLSSMSNEVEFLQMNLATDDLEPALSGVTHILHLAAQPGVRASWERFDEYVTNNILATKRLLDAAVQSGVARLVYASSSSVYGDAPEYPTTEGAPLRPRSPYGVTKLAAEQLCIAYSENHNLSTVSLRYFTVYGPRQRPDMATFRLIEAARNGTSFPLYGDGQQIRDFTFVSDVARANAAALVADVAPGSVYNIAGGDSCSMLQLIETVQDVVGKPIRLDRYAKQAGDVIRTGGGTAKAALELGWEATTTVREGVSAQAHWHSNRAGM